MIQIKFFTPPPPPFLYSMLSVEAVPTHAAHKLTKKPLAHCHIRTPIFATKYRIPVYVWPKKKEKKKKHSKRTICSEILCNKDEY